MGTTDTENSENYGRAAKTPTGLVAAVASSWQRRKQA